MSLKCVNESVSYQSAFIVASVNSREIVLAIFRIRLLITRVYIDIQEVYIGDCYTNTPVNKK